MKDRTPIDYGNVPIRKMPPGKALGADDLTKWAHRRALGSSGTGTEQTRAVVLECSACGSVSEAMAVERGPRKNKRGIHECRHCGEKAARVVKTKRINVR